MPTGYSDPGQLLEFNREGHVLYRYDVSRGPGMLNRPSLAERLPDGIIMLNDDYRNRVVAFDPTTGALVWPYGVSDSPGTASGMLNRPGGFDCSALRAPAQLTPIPVESDH